MLQFHELLIFNPLTKENMKNKNLLFCFNTEASLKAKRLVFQTSEVPHPPEKGEKMEYAVDKKEKEKQAETMKNAKWLLKHLEDTDFGSVDRNRGAKKHGLALEEAIKTVEKAEKDKFDIERAYSDLDIKLNAGRAFIEKIRLEDEEKERNKLFASAKNKLDDAVIFFRDSDNSKNKAMLEKNVSDFMNDFWGRLNDKQRKLLSGLDVASGISTGPVAWRTHWDVTVKFTDKLEIIVTKT